MGLIEDTDARFKDDDRIYFFEWTENGGSTRFGYHGTEDEWDAYQVLHLKGREIKITEKRFCCTGKEQKEHARQVKADVRRLMTQQDLNRMRQDLDPGPSKYYQDFKYEGPGPQPGEVLDDPPPWRKPDGTTPS